MSTKYCQIDEQILTSNRYICRALEKLKASERGEISQDILGHLRNFVEHAMLKIYARENNLSDVEDSQDYTKIVVAYIKKENKLRWLSKFHHFIQISISHRTLCEENSERLMLKFYEYLFKLRDFLHKQYSLTVLLNLESFLRESNEETYDYYKKIALKVEQYKTSDRKASGLNRFYIKTIKPFFIDKKMYYEVSFIPANDKFSKTSLLVAYTDMEISPYYAVKLAIVDSYIELFNKQMPIRLIVYWEVNIRQCEYKNFSKLFDGLGFIPNSAELIKISNFLTKSMMTLSEVVLLPQDKYQKVREYIGLQPTAPCFGNILDKCRELINQKKSGSNVILYLLYHMRNAILKKQFEKQWANGRYIGPNNWLSDLYLSNKCLPFDKMPFCSALIEHVPRLWDLFNCFETINEYELLARIIKNNTEYDRMLFTPLEKNEDKKFKYANFNDVQALVDVYNQKLYGKHRPYRDLVIDKEHIYMYEYKNDTVQIIKRIKELSLSGIDNFSSLVTNWLENNSYIIDCEEKKKILSTMFSNSHVSLIYGAAGTGKTTMIKHVSAFFKLNSKLFLAHTNPAVNNLKRKVLESSNGEFMTVSRYMSSSRVNNTYDILIIDECSTISNRDMRMIIEKSNFKLLILVGDIYQIESIEFGNWFEIIEYFLPKTAVCKLEIPYRASNKQLLNLWNSVRVMDDDVYCRLQGGEFSTVLNHSIFTKAYDNEIILCLNYGGLYGINNINYFMQKNNNGKEVLIGVHKFKVGDPILFNDYAENFFVTDSTLLPLIHNNMKGKILDFAVVDENLPTERITFDIELYESLNHMNEEYMNFQILGASDNGNSIIRFSVNKNNTTDDDDDLHSNSIVPFQIAYAVSIHKAQGLEYDSVKVIISCDVDELITHSIFYTAITRARKKLKIYWSKTTERKILSMIKPRNSRKDVAFLKQDLTS